MKLGSPTASNQETQPRRIDQKRLWLFFFRISKNGNRRDWEKNRKSMVRLRECVRIVWVKLSSWELGLVWSRGMHCNLKISFIKSASISHGWCVRPWEKNIAADAIIWTYPSLTMYFDILWFFTNFGRFSKAFSLFSGWWSWFFKVFWWFYHCQPCIFFPKPSRPIFLRFFDHHMLLSLMVANHRSNDAMFAMYRSSLI